MIALNAAILQTLHYFAFFKHPLSAQEIWQYLSVPATQTQVNKALEQLVAQQQLEAQDGFYVMCGKISWIEKRMAALQENHKLLRIGKRVGKFIATFPFVKAVFISGSLSKKGAFENDDIDFFIIAESGRVWLAKAVLIAFKKLFLFNSKKYFCINFIVGTDALEIKKRNIYTATEAASVVPITQNAIALAFRQANAKWIRTFFPNHESGQLAFHAVAVQEPSNRKFLIVDRIDGWCMQLFQKNTQRKYKNLSNATILADKSTAALFPESPEAALLTHYHNKIHHA
ncbi:MAG: hypothetical protein LAT76_11420 [Schleiferiaceae bacterium]|nr:hypothetical protein [Schleiferiaceae bacterium]